MLPALIWKLLSWIWYTFLSKTGNIDAKAEAVGAKCPMSGQVKTDKTKCPGGAKAEVSAIVEPQESV